MCVLLWLFYEISEVICVVNDRDKGNESTDPTHKSKTNPSAMESHRTRTARILPCFLHTPTANACESQ